MDAELVHARTVKRLIVRTAEQLHLLAEDVAGAAAEAERVTDWMTDRVDGPDVHRSYTKVVAGVLQAIVDWQNGAQLGHLVEAAGDADEARVLRDAASLLKAATQAREATGR